MKDDLTKLALLSILAVGCGEQAKQIAQTKEEVSAQTAMTEQEESQNEMYLQDLVESAGYESTDSSTATAETPASDSSSEDADKDEDILKTVENDIKEKRLTQMAEMLMKKLDTDSSSTISLTEFLAPPTEQGKKIGASEEIQNTIIAKLTQDFKKFAGEDELMSIDELKALLKAVAPRIGRHRCGQDEGMKEGRGPRPFGPGHPERRKLSAAEFIAKYDKDGDGKLSEEEIDAFKTERRGEEGPDKPRHPGFGTLRKDRH